VRGASKVDDLDDGWRCRDCDELVLVRYFLEGTHDGDVTPPYGSWGAGVGVTAPGP
jgi:hypothetical protein